MKLRWREAQLVAEQDAIQFDLHSDAPPGGSLRFGPRLFPYDRFHQTFVNVYEGESLRQQFIFASDSEPDRYYRGTAAGALAVMRTFIPARAR